VYLVCPFFLSPNNNKIFTFDILKWLNFVFGFHLRPYFEDKVVFGEGVCSGCHSKPSSFVYFTLLVFSDYYKSKLLLLFPTDVSVLVVNFPHRCLFVTS